MVSIDQLEGLDYLIWLGSGEAAGERLKRTQSTISRQSGVCARIFRLQLKKENRSWSTKGNGYLLDLERSVHQLARLQGLRKIRVEISPWDQELLNPQGLTELELGYCGDGRPRRALELLKNRVVDAYFTRFGASLQELSKNETNIKIIPLASFEIGAMAPKQLAEASNADWTVNALKKHQLINWEQGVLPRLEQQLSRLGLWRGGATPTRGDILMHWEQSAKNGHLITFDKLIPATLNRQLSRLNLELGCKGSWGLAMLKDPQNSDICDQLCAHLQVALNDAKHHFPSLTVI